MTTPIKWHGGKTYLADRIVELMPPRTGWHLYREPFAGGLSVLLRLQPLKLCEAINDLNGGLTNFWDVLRSPETFPEFGRRCQFTPFSVVAFREAQRDVKSPDPVTRAVAFFVLVRQSRQGLRREFATPTRRLRRGMNENASAWLSAVDGVADVHERLRRVEVRRMDAVAFIHKYDAPEAVFYCDPPYLHETLHNGGGEHAHEMSNEQHAELSQMSGRFVLSGYRSELYDDDAALHGWHRHEFILPNSASSRPTKERKTECVWTNFTEAH